MLTKKVHHIELPEEFHKYFWDLESDVFVYEKHPRFVAERLLNYGDTGAIKWLLAHMKKSFIRSVIDTSRNLNAKTKNYWQMMLK